jgi:hypothetical protein
MREAGLSYRVIAHRVGRSVATVLRCCHAGWKTNVTETFTVLLMLVMAQLLYGVIKND